MTNRLKLMGETASWRLMVGAATKGAEAKGYRLARQPGRGLSNTWEMEKGGVTKVASVRTTRDRWIAFPPLEKGKRWKTLDDVDLVLASVVDDKDDPQNVEVYLFPADEVRKRFDAAYAARIAAGNVLRENYGMWVNLDPDDRGLAVSAGSGLAKDYPAIAKFSLDELSTASTGTGDGKPDSDDEVVTMLDEATPSTIAEVVAWAREQIARIAGVRPEAVKLDIKIEY